MKTSVFEQKKVELELRNFAARNFVKPALCENGEQVRFYISELLSRIARLKDEGYDVPGFAYTLLAQYNAVQNRFLHIEFRNSYC